MKSPILSLNLILTLTAGSAFLVGCQDQALGVPGEDTNSSSSSSLEISSSSTDTPCPVPGTIPSLSGDSLDCSDPEPTPDPEPQPDPQPHDSASCVPGTVSILNCDIDDSLVYADSIDFEVFLTQEDSGTTVTVRSGQAIQVLLDANPTTGYQWLPGTQTASWIQSQDYLPSAETLEGTVGSGGTSVFTLAFPQPGSYWVDLRYTRDWEEGIGPDGEMISAAIRVFQVEIIVE